MSFSERYGYKPLREIIQIESMDAPLRNGLWSILKILCWDRVVTTPGTYGAGGRLLYAYGNEEINKLCQSLWFNYFKKPLDQLSNDWDVVLGQLRKYFFEYKWYEVYDFIEFVANNYNKGSRFREDFTGSCNGLLEKEMSAYRFVNGVITRITDEHEVAEIEQAVEGARGPVNRHLRRSPGIVVGQKGA